MSFVEKSYAKQSAHFSIREEELHERFELESIDRWRHGRMYDSVRPIINSGESWLTVGDGRYGSDAFFLQKRGVEKVLPTDISETLLKIGKEKGIIDDYRIENAEELSFEDSAFDWAFCKEAYHHFPRPMIAVYEMLRVAKQGIVLIEPNDGLIESRHTSNVYAGFQFFIRTLINKMKRILNKPVFYPFGGHEEAGNFIFSISKREIEKVAMGIDLPWVAFKGQNDYYEKGLERELATEKNHKFKEVKKNVQMADVRVAKGKAFYSLMTAIIGKTPINQTLKSRLEKEGFEVIDLPRNPYLSR